MPRLSNSFYLCSRQAYLICMESGPPLVAKIAYNHKNDVDSLGWLKDTLHCETIVYTLLTRCQPPVPVARILAVDLGPNFSIGDPFMLMEKMEGEDLWSAWMTMTLHQKVGMGLSILIIDILTL